MSDIKSSEKRYDYIQQSQKRLNKKYAHILHLISSEDKFHASINPSKYYDIFDKEVDALIQKMKENEGNKTKLKDIIKQKECAQLKRDLCNLELVADALHPFMLTEEEEANMPYFETGSDGQLYLVI